MVDMNRRVTGLYSRKNESKEECKLIPDVPKLGGHCFSTDIRGKYGIKPIHCISNLWYISFCDSHPNSFSPDIYIFYWVVLSSHCVLKHCNRGVRRCFGGDTNCKWLRVNFQWWRRYFLYLVEQENKKVRLLVNSLKWRQNPCSQTDVALFLNILVT